MSKKKPVYPVVTPGQKVRVRFANGRIADSWPAGQPLKPGCVQLSEKEWQDAKAEREAAEKAKAAKAAK